MSYRFTANRGAHIILIDLTVNKKYEWLDKSTKPDIIQHESEFSFMATSLIFVDVHGPLQSARVHFGETVIDDGERQYDRLDPLSIACLKRLVARTGSKLVMNSTLNKLGEDFLIRLFELNGYEEFPEHLHRHWKTAYGDGLPKDLCVKSYLHNAKVNGEDISHYVVLDDMKMDVENLILVDYDQGLSVKNYQDAIKLLGARDAFIIW